MQEILLSIRRYQRAMSDLTLIALFGAVNLFCALFGSSFYMLFAPCLPTLLYYGGRHLSERLEIPALLTVGIFLSLCMMAVFFFLRFLSRGRYRVMLAAAILYGVDTAILAAFSLSAGFVTGLADSLLHLWVLLVLVRAVLAGRRIDRMPIPTSEDIEEMFRELALPPEGTPPGTLVGDAPPDESDSIPLREEVPRRKYFFRKTVLGLKIRVPRSHGLTELCINGQVYAEVRGVVEFAYSLTATVEGHRVSVRLSPGGLYGRMVLFVDGRLAAERRRYF